MPGQCYPLPYQIHQEDTDTDTWQMYCQLGSIRACKARYGRSKLLRNVHSACEGYKVNCRVVEILDNTRVPSLVIYDLLQKLSCCLKTEEKHELFCHYNCRLLRP